MFSKETILQQLRACSPYLATEFGVTRIGLFGSFAQGTADEASDIDVVVEFQHPIGFKFIELAEYLERQLGRRVDLLTPAGLQNIRMSEVANDIAESIIYV